MAHGVCSGTSHVQCMPVTLVKVTYASTASLRRSSLVRADVDAPAVDASPPQPSPGTDGSNPASALLQTRT